MRNMKLAVIGTGALLLVGLTACVAPQTASGPEKESHEVSLVKSYSDLTELESDSALIVTAKVAEDYDVVEMNGMAFTLRVVIPEKVHKGEAAQKLTVMTVGTPSDEGALEPGSTHLLFLKEYELNPGEPTGDYVLTDFAGDYVRSSRGIFEHFDDESPQLPEKISAEELADLIE